MFNSCYWDYLEEAGIGKTVYDESSDVSSMSSGYPWLAAYYDALELE
jgi:hypothetical protein